MILECQVINDHCINVSQVDTLKWETDAALQVDTLTSKETYRHELVEAVQEVNDALAALRTALTQHPPENASSEDLAAAAKNIAKAGTKPSHPLELSKHLSELLLTECDATEEEAMLKDVEFLALTYEDLLAQAKKKELQINNLRLVLLTIFNCLLGSIFLASNIWLSKLLICRHTCIFFQILNLNFLLH